MKLGTKWKTDIDNMIVIGRLNEKDFLPDRNTKWQQFRSLM